MSGKNIKFERGKGNIKGVGKYRMSKKGNEKKYLFPLNIKAVGKNII